MTALIHSDTYFFNQNYSLSRMIDDISFFSGWSLLIFYILFLVFNTINYLLNLDQDCLLSMTSILYAFPEENT